MPKFRVVDSSPAVEVSLLQEEDGEVILVLTDTSGNEWHVAALEESGCLRLIPEIESGDIQTDKSGYIKVVKI